MLLSQGTFPVPGGTPALTTAQLVLVLLKISAGPAKKEMVLVGFWMWCLETPVSLISE